MTIIDITGTKEDLEKISFQLRDLFNKSGVCGKIESTELRHDSADANIITVLQVTFSGVIAIVQVIGLILKFQEDRQNYISEEKKAISITIEAGNGRKIDLKLFGEMTDDEINKCLTSVQEFRGNLLKPQSQHFYVVNEDNTILFNFEEINNSFASLLTKTQRIKELRSTVIENEVKKACKIEMVEVSLIEILRKENNKPSFYLPIKDIEGCEDIFFTFETANILNFHQIKNEITGWDMENMYVKYELEKMSFFAEIVENKKFKFYASFNSSS